MTFSHANTYHVMMQQSSFSPLQRPTSSTVMDIFYTESLETYVDSFQPGEQGEDLFILYWASSPVNLPITRNITMFKKTKPCKLYKIHTE